MKNSKINWNIIEKKYDFSFYYTGKILKAVLPKKQPFKDFFGGGTDSSSISSGSYDDAWNFGSSGLSSSYSSYSLGSSYSSYGFDGFDSFGGYDSYSLW